MKQELKFKDCNNCLGAIRFENKINKVENKIDVNSLKESHRVFLKDKRLTLKSKKS